MGLEIAANKSDACSNWNKDHETKSVVKLITQQGERMAVSLSCGDFLSWIIDKFSVVYLFQIVSSQVLFVSWSV